MEKFSYFFPLLVNWKSYNNISENETVAVLSAEVKKRNNLGLCGAFSCSNSTTSMAHSIVGLGGILMSCAMGEYYNEHTYKQLTFVFSSFNISLLFSTSLVPGPLKLPI